MQYFNMFHPLLVLLSTAALLQVGFATPPGVRDVAAEPGNVTSNSRKYQIPGRHSEANPLRFVVEDAETGRNCFCTMEYAPVCAGNKVYASKCKAMCAGETEHLLGGCNQSS